MVPLPELPAEILQSVPGQGKSWPCAGELQAHLRNCTLETREENLKKVAWESYLGQNSLKVLNDRGLRSCFPLEILPHACRPCEFGLPEGSLGSGRGQSTFGSSLTQLVQREKAWSHFGWRHLRKHPKQARFNWWTAKSLWGLLKSSETPGGWCWEQESCAPSSSSWAQ